MKLGIVTVYNSLNLGSYLQAYALGKELCKQGHEVYYIKGGNSNLYIGQIRKSLISSIKYGPDVLYKTIEKCIYNKKDLRLLKESTNASRMDGIILGSDEIWNINKQKFRNTLFWGDIAGVPFDRIVPYAICCGNSKVEDFKAQKKYIDCMCSFKKIMVRDINSYNIVRECTDVEVQKVCDPTLLINWKIDENYNMISDNDIIVYGYYFDELQRKAIMNYANAKGKRVVAVSLYQNWCDNINISALDFPSAVSRAYAVVTNTFHGTLFSILFSKRFITLAQSIKVKDLVNSFGIENKMYSGELGINELENVLNNKIDRENIHNIIREERIQSSKALEAAILEMQ